ncbi:MAG: polyribonucleotide nucleotidyltransferase [Bacilli bacterium]
MSKKTFKLNFLGRDLIVETGELAKQANGSVLVRYGDTVILTAAVMGKTAITQDFFPLTVLYQEKLYSVGKIPGGFIKREGRPTDSATLTARLIDRPIRPMFDENFRNEVQVINTVLSVDTDYSPEMSALFGSSLALGISDIPFDGPVAGVIVGKIGKDYIINPTAEQAEKSTINLTVAGTKDAICMVEAGAKEVTEREMLEALMFGHEHIKMLCEFQQKIIDEVGKEKIEVELATIDPEIEKAVREFATDKMFDAFKVKGKLAQYAAIDAVKEETITHFGELYSEDENLEEILKDVKKLVDILEGEGVRFLITDKKTRPDGRKMDEIRPLWHQIDLLPRTHGSAVFTRGETQSLATTTLGALNEHQILDGLGLEDTKRFMLHYNFPQFSVGEVGRYGSPGRREIGHGALGERALLQVMPSEDEFPYTVRVVSEILESNGSSSQATICAGCLSLMAAGVPIKAPVAGIAMGLITSKDGKKYTILTDIQGLEDHMGDMDFKVAGTKEGITALQMDIKIKGVTKQILKEALEQAKKARLEILDSMAKTIEEPRKELSKYAPKIEQMQINPDKIKDVIGKGGETITNIILTASNVTSVNDKDAVKVDLDDNGRVLIYHTDINVIKKTKELIENITREVESGKVYNGKVVKIEEFGCFVELWPGCEGLCHVSQLAYERVEKPSDMFKVGDEIIVKALGYDNKNRLNLSRKEALPKKENKDTKEKSTKSDKKDTKEKSKIEKKETKKDNKDKKETETKPKKEKKSLLSILKKDKK